MNHPIDPTLQQNLSLCVVIFAMLVGVAISQIPHMPRCPFCGKTREHARDCSEHDRSH